MTTDLFFKFWTLSTGCLRACKMAPLVWWELLSYCSCTHGKERGKDAQNIYDEYSQEEGSSTCAGRVGGKGGGSSLSGLIPKPCTNTEVLTHHHEVCYSKKIVTMIHKADNDLRNIRVEDPRPTLQHFFLLMEGFKPYSDPEERRKLHICSWSLDLKNFSGLQESL